MTSSVVLFLMFAALVGTMLTGAPLAFVLGGVAFLFTVSLWGMDALVISVWAGLRSGQ
jgi:TRAP-type mannitol/chloroaromatic compound transport system permease large subunit